MPASPATLSVRDHLRLTCRELADLELVHPLGGGSNENWLGHAALGPVVLKVFTGTWDDPAAAACRESASLRWWAGTGITPALLAAGPDPAPHVVTRFACGSALPPGGAVGATAAVCAAAARLHAARPADLAAWPRLLDGWLADIPHRLAARDADPAVVAEARRCLAQLAAHPVALIHGDVAPWNVLVGEEKVVLLDPMAKTGPAAFDPARWAVTAALTDLYAGGPVSSPRLRQLLDQALIAAARPGLPGLAAAARLELFNRASFADPRWPSGYAGLLLAAAATIPQ